jgi:hypothetical protein
MTKPSWQDFGTHDESAHPRLWDGVVGAWCPSLGPTGSRLHDMGGRSNWGTLTNMDNATDWVINDGQYALDFDSTNDHVDTGTQLAFLDGSPQFTMCFWARRRTAGAALPVGKRTGNNFVLIAPWIDGNVYFEISPNFPSAASNILDWSHYAMTLRNSTITGFINGRQVASGAGPATMPSVAANYIIGLEAGVPRYADGFFDDVRVYSRALSHAEIQLLANYRGISYERKRRTIRRLTPEQAGFRPYWALNRNQIIGGGLR